ncbi:hypothetical protein N665_0259s0031 [Sinapis alba]|nr:hypothetical protein N665_0259s0031 [Sinapis alba]
MGKIVRLLKNHKTVLDCYKDLNKSIKDMDINRFETEACKTMLMSPRSIKDIHRRRLKMNVAYTNPIKFFVCPSFFESGSYGNMAYNNFKASVCSYEDLMSTQILVPEEEQVDEVDLQETVLDLACSLSDDNTDNTILGCVGNLCTSPCRVAASKSLLLPQFYNYSNNNLLEYGYQSTTYECLNSNSCSSCKVARCGTGFIKKNTNFIVSNDLTITPMNTYSTIGLLKNMQVDISDLERYQISISRVELINILRASLISSSALTLARQET